MQTHTHTRTRDVHARLGVCYALIVYAYIVYIGCEIFLVVVVERLLDFSVLNFDFKLFLSIKSVIIYPG